MKKAIILLLMILSSGVYAQLDFEEVEFRNDLRNKILFEINRERGSARLEPVIINMQREQDSDEAVTLLYSAFSPLESLGNSDYQDAHDMIDYHLGSGGGRTCQLIYYFQTEGSVVRDIRNSLRTNGSLLKEPNVRWVAISVLEDEYGQLYAVILGYS